MLDALWISKTGLDTQQSALNLIANNLANINTTGYKSAHGLFEDLFYQTYRYAGTQSGSTTFPVNLQFGTGSRITGTVKNFAQGTLNQTTNPLYVAISGKGFFQIQMPDGTTAYSRAGDFQRDSGGQMVTPGGYPLLPNIVIPSDTKSISIAKDGTVSVTTQGSTAPASLGQIQLANFANPEGLSSAGENLLQETAASGSPIVGVPGLQSLGYIEQSSLEASNVNVAEQLVEMIQAQRAYEFNTKVLQASDQMMEKITQI